MTNPLEEIIAHGNRPNHKPFETYRERRAALTPNWIRLGDGTVISVIAGAGTYCWPRVSYDEDFILDREVPPDYPGPYTAVEVWFPREDQPDSVGVDELRVYVESHGGVVGAYRTSKEAKEGE